ncbi:UNKNOWN [Stylonychia lemnae]|uniref:Uncharacterized protein n=1 Tax=Stylonychia lemnae TaxID=5949 RepID=A0A078AXY3_STYLE|nr:UNKNOWN [Stylonychia lemnae]|eukprot:CDW86941.1 UNKNOWN [Stylonychia lemnae]
MSLVTPNLLSPKQTAVSAPVSPKLNQSIIVDGYHSNNQKPVKGLMGYAQKLLEKRENRVFLQETNRNKLDISRLQFVHNPLFDFPSTDLSTFEMIVNQQQNHDDQLSIQWDKIDEWNRQNRHVKARENRGLKSKVSGNQQNPITPLELSSTTLEDEPKNQLSKSLVNKKKYHLPQIALEHLDYSGNILEQSLIDHSTNNEKGIQENLKKFFQDQMRKKAFNTPIKGNKGGHRYSVRRMREDFYSKDQTSSKFGARNSILYNNSSLFNFERRNLEKEQSKTQKLNATGQGSKFLSGFSQYNPTDQEQQKIVNLQILRELSKLKNQAVCRDKQWSKQFYNRKTSNDDSIKNSYIYSQIHSSAAIRDKSQMQQTQTQSKFIQQAPKSGSNQSPYPFQFQGKMIFTYADLLQFCELDKAETLMELKKQQQKQIHVHHSQQQKNFDEELFKLIQEIKQQEKMHLRKPSTLDNLVLLQRIDDYYHNKDQ